MAVKITITEEELKALDDAYDGLTATVRSTGAQGARASSWVCVFRAPKRQEWKRFVQTREKDLHTAVETLFHAACIFPDRVKRDELLEVPGCAGVPFACLEAISALMGVDGETAVGK